MVSFAKNHTRYHLRKCIYLKNTEVIILRPDQSRDAPTSCTPTGFILHSLLRFFRIWCNLILRAETVDERGRFGRRHVWQSFLKRKLNSSSTSRVRGEKVVTSGKEEIKRKVKWCQSCEFKSGLQHTLKKTFILRIFAVLFCYFHVLFSCILLCLFFMFFMVHHLPEYYCSLQDFFFTMYPQFPISL